jgi:hypothetical protein
MSYLTAVAILLLMLLPVIIPAVISGFHAVAGLRARA